MHIDVPGTGKPDAKILIVGEQPGRQEMQTGRPFVGPAGRELDTSLARAGITRRECYLTNVIKTLRQPLQTFYNSETGVFYESAKPYIDYLREEILRVSPNILVAVGNVALAALCSRKGITKWRGSLIESTLIPGLKVIPIVHPAFIIPPKNQWKYRPLSVLDLTKVARESEFPELHHTERELLTGPSYHECLSFLDECYYAGLSGQTIDCDIEVSLETREITCIAFALSPTRAMSIPFIGPRGDYFTPEQEIEVWQAIAAILEHPEITKAGQNFIFDSFFLLHRYHISISGRIEDTMIAQKILCPDLPVGLDTITSIHTDIPYYKGEGKEWIVNKVGTFQNFWEYNALDTIATAAARESQIPELHRQKNYETYLRTCRVIYPLLYMMQRGVLTDIAGMIAHREKVVKEIEELEAELTELAGYQLNYNSPKQLKQYFYETKGLKPYKKRGAKGSVVTTDVDAMKRIARKGYREASIILALRHKTTKALGVYLNPEKVDPDGRYRCHYNPVGTDSGRLSSSTSIFGTGSNRQNWPHQYLRYLLIDPGYVGYWFDLAQAENRIVAYVGNVLEMIETFESGADLHSLTGALISGKTPEEVKKEDEENVYCHLGDGSKTWRYYGKKSNHSINYDIGPGRFSLVLEIPQKEGRWLIDQYYRAYPGVRHGYQKSIRDMLHTSRMVPSLMGRRRLFLGPLDAETYRTAYAQLPQSSVGDKVNEHGLNYIYYNPQKFGPIELLEQVHDSIGFQIPLSIPWSAHAEMLWDIKQSLEQPYHWHGREFVVPADLTIGLNFCKEEGIDIKYKAWPRTPKELAGTIEERYQKLLEDPEVNKA